MQEPYVDFIHLRRTVQGFAHATVLESYGVMTPEAVSQEIYAANVALQAAKSGLHDAVDRAGKAGFSWTEIGRAMGITKQAAQQRFGG